MTRLAVLAVVGLCFGAAQAQIGIIRDFDPVGPGLTENPNCSGFAVSFYDSNTGMTTIVVAMFGFRPNTTYGLQYCCEAESGFDNHEAVRTNFLGWGFFSHSFPQNGTSNTLTIYRWNGQSDFMEDREATGEIRARGSPS